MRGFPGESSIDAVWSFEAIQWQICCGRGILPRRETHNIEAQRTSDVARWFRVLPAFLLVNSSGSSLAVSHGGGSAAAALQLLLPRRGKMPRPQQIPATAGTKPWRDIFHRWTKTSGPVSPHQPESLSHSAVWKGGGGCADGCRRAWGGVCASAS